MSEAESKVVPLVRNNVVPFIRPATAAASAGTEGERHVYRPEFTELLGLMVDNRPVLAKMLSNFR